MKLIIYRVYWENWETNSDGMGSYRTADKARYFTKLLEAQKFYDETVKQESRWKYKDKDGWEYDNQLYKPTEVEIKKLGIIPESIKEYTIFTNIRHIEKILVK